MKNSLQTLQGLVDINDQPLVECSIIDIHQTVNGCNLFRICKDQSGYYVKYHHNHCDDIYEYDVAELLEVNEYEKTIEIVGHYTLSQNETILEQLAKENSFTSVRNAITCAVTYRNAYNEYLHKYNSVKDVLIAIKGVLSKDLNELIDVKLKENDIDLKA